MKQSILDKYNIQFYKNKGGGKSVRTDFRKHRNLCIVIGGFENTSIVRGLLNDINLTLGGHYNQLEEPDIWMIAGIHELYGSL